MEVGYITPPITLEREDEAKTLLNQLVGGPKQLDVVTIVGMPGLGKTTFATKLYSHEAVKERYDVRSWCCVSQTYDRKSVLLEIMRGLDKGNTTTEESDLADEIRRFLKGKRYLIVVDDLWSSDAWDDLLPIFPDDNKGSRLVLTTRLDEVASYASDNPHHLRHLTKEESWELLKKIVFREKSCPSELEKIGNKIARSCAGLPLAVVLSAGLLDREKKKVDYWKEVSQNLSSTLFHDAKWLMDVVELSYKILPHDLKQCFLYFGSFYEDEKISVQKLIQLWVCEGFIPHNNDLENLDHVATNYLTDLIGRNLVMVAKRTYSGKAKYVRIHDLLHQFCMRKAEEIHLRFYGLRDTNSSWSCTSFRNVGYDILISLLLSCSSLCRSEIPDCDHPQLESTMPYRLIVSSLNDDFMKWSSLYESSCSLRFNVSVDATPSLTNSVGAFKSLTVLDLGKVNVGFSFPKGIMLLIHLRYLDIYGYFDVVPSTISSLVNLKILIIPRIFVNFPYTIWNLVNLRHLQVHMGLFPNPRYTPHKVSPLKKLETCSEFIINLPGDMPILVHGLSNVVNLKCEISDKSSDHEDYNCNKPYDSDDYRYGPPLFQSLHRLESLSLEYDQQYPPARRVFEFPSTLKILELEDFPFCEPLRSISSIGKLPNLEVLRLRRCRYEGKWDVKDNDFPKLKVLKVSHQPKLLHYWDAKDNEFPIRWNSSEEAFPSLQQLLLHYCDDVEIPSNFGYLSSLKLVKLLGCCDHTVESAIKIKKIQIDEICNSNFNLIVIEKPMGLFGKPPCNWIWVEDFDQ